MKHTLTAALLTFALAPLAQAEDLEARAAASRDASEQLLAALQEMVTEAAQAKGAAHAIEKCNLNALDITEKLSAELGMEIGRTSHKLRQAKNAPDAWEQAVLEKFLEREAAGEDLKQVEYYEVVDEDGQQTFRYMKAIPLGGVCYNCHGMGIRKDVQAKLDELYPDDQATGFVPGQLRGAFTIRQQIGE
ncbi:MAG: DUF3365 domain-containing protein [Pseudomonadota bacterium]